VTRNKKGIIEKTKNDEKKETQPEIRWTVRRHLKRGLPKAAKRLNCNNFFVVHALLSALGVERRIHVFVKYLQVGNSLHVGFFFVRFVSNSCMPLPCNSPAWQPPFFASAETSFGNSDLERQDKPRGFLLTSWGLLLQMLHDERTMLLYDNEGNEEGE
jgi:hypothetical protein